MARRTQPLEDSINNTTAVPVTAPIKPRILCLLAMAAHTVPGLLAACHDHIRPQRLILSCPGNLKSGSSGAGAACAAPARQDRPWTTDQDLYLRPNAPHGG